MVHFPGSCMALLRSTPVMGGPLTSAQRQGCPRVLTALQHASLGGTGLMKDETAGLHGNSCTRAEKKVLGHAWPAAMPSKPTDNASMTRQTLAMVILVAEPDFMATLTK